MSIRKEINWEAIILVVSLFVISSVIIFDGRRNKALEDKIESLEIEVARQKDRAATFERLFHQAQFKSLK